MRGGALRLAAWLTVAAAVAACSSAPSPPDLSFRPFADGEVAGPVAVAVGDIACRPGFTVTDEECRHQAVARVAAVYRPHAVLALGDLQYEKATLQEFRRSYDAAWGRFKPITRPVPGNHEYRTPGASGYFGYFDGQVPAPPGSYAFTLGSWRLYAINSNCAHVDCERQEDWLDRAMAASDSRCSALVMHHPRFSSGEEHGSAPAMTRFWRIAYQHGADVAVAGHDHHYERLARLDHHGDRASDGIVSFVAGTGGRDLHGYEDIASGSVVRYNDDFGVLALRLGRGRFAWEFRALDREVKDSGTRRCR